jgi:hypothetical protein
MSVSYPQIAGWTDSLRVLSCLFIAVSLPPVSHPPSSRSHYKFHSRHYLTLLSPMAIISLIPSQHRCPAMLRRAGMLTFSSVHVHAWAAMLRQMRSGKPVGFLVFESVNHLPRALLPHDFQPWNSRHAISQRAGKRFFIYLRNLTINFW